jgi:hypothetical protein
LTRPFLVAATAAALACGVGPAASAAPPNPPTGGAPSSYRLVDATSASVNGEIIFLSDVVREACFERCGALPAEEAESGVSLSEARKKLIYNRLILQEQRKLSLGAVDNEALAAAVSGVTARMGRCADPCAKAIGEADIRAFVSDRALVAGFLDKRVSVFIEVPDEEVQRAIGQRAATEGKDPESYSEDAVRAELRREKSSLEVRNWYYKAAANARIFLSPLEDEK